MTLASLCFAAWCAFGSPAPSETSVIVAQDAFLKNDATERLALVETRQVFAGIVAGAQPAAIVGMLPLRLERGRVRVDGGVSAASAPVPLRGTRLNWVARARLRVVARLSIEFLHFSNSGSRRANPSLDALAIGWRF